MKTNKIINYSLGACFLFSLFLFACAPKETDKDPAEIEENVEVRTFALPYELECGEEISHTYKEVCDTTEATAKKKIEDIFSEHFKCKAGCSPTLTVSATETGTCVFNIPTLRDGKQYDITVKLSCK